MKTGLLASLVSVFSVAAFAQGTVNFVNINPGAGLNAPIFWDPNNTIKLSGPAYTAELLAGSSAVTLAVVAQTGFLTGAGAGYFQGGVVTLANVAPGATAFLEVRVFSTSSGSFPAAQAANIPGTWGQSSIFSVITGGAGTPPSTPAALTGLNSFNIYGFPEPSTPALVAFGAAVLLCGRRGRFHDSGTS